MRTPCTTPRLGLLGDCFIYAAPALHSQACRHSATLACALTPEPLTVRAQGRHWQGRLLVLRPFVDRLIDSGGRPVALVDIEPLHPRYPAFSRGSEPVQLLAAERFAGLLACARAFAAQALAGRQLHAAVQLQVHHVADAIAPREPVDPLVLDMMAALRDDPSLSLARLGPAVGLSPTRASRRFVAALGLTVRQYALSVKIRRAALFYGSGLPLTQVAQAAGFTDSSHFTRVWQRCYGGTPSRYFAQHRDALAGRVEHAWRQRVPFTAPA